MRQISLREFRIRGAKAMQAVPRGETVLLAGQKGPAYFLVPVIADLAAEERELSRALAKASLRDSWRCAQQAGLDRLTHQEIDREIARARRTLRPSTAARPRGK